MMKNKRAGEVLKYLSDFKRAGLSMCGQIVLCRGVNDGEELKRTMHELSEYFPELSSVSVVPAGLTKFRDKLYPLSDFTEREAGEIIDLIDGVANEHLKKHGSRLFFAADELYLKARREIPSADYYEEYPQIENGVGMLRSLIDDFGLELSDADYYKDKVASPRSVSVATGVAAYPTVSALCEKMERIFPNLQINVYKIINSFFGESITVAGLLTGSDIKSQLLGKPLGDELLIPECALRHGEDVFLCGMTVPELSEALGVRIAPAGDGYDLFLKLLGEE
jgi:putative radical SAM enzyme (TIGR03279 family)